MTKGNVLDTTNNEMIDRNKDIEENKYFKEKEQRLSNPNRTVMQNVNGPNTDLSDIINIAPG